MLQQAKVPLDQPLRIVVADDNDADREMVRRLLGAEKNFFVEQTSSEEGLLSLLAGDEVDCVIIDRTLGGESSFEIHDKVRAKYLDPPAIIMLTGGGNERFATKAFRSGFSDYVKKKPLNANELVVAVQHAVDRKHAEKFHRAEYEQLAALALRDPITGLPNRQFLEERLRMLFASRKRHRSPFATLTIGINGFATLNDSFGHAVGDAALKAFAQRLMQVSRSSEIFGRLGGAKFLYLIDSNVTAEAVESTCRRLGEALSFSIELEKVGLSLSSSIGVAIYPRDGVTTEELLDAAGRARHVAQSTGEAYALASATRSMSGANEVAGDADDARLAMAPGIDAGIRAASDAEPFFENLFAPSNLDTEAFASHDASRDDSNLASNGTAHDLAESGPQAAHREENRRVERRHRVLKRGTIVTNDGNSTVDCVIRDLSLHGARVAVEAEYNAPRRFSLLIVETGNRLPVERRWQKGRDIGLRFLN